MHIFTNLFNLKKKQLDFSVWFAFFSPQMQVFWCKLHMEKYKTERKKDKMIWNSDAKTDFLIVTKKIGGFTS